MADVTLKGLTKYYGNVVAVDGIDLKIADKEFVILVGPSGCGKTTTLRMVAGLETPDSGEIYIGDQLVTDVATRDRNIAMVFQNYALYPHMDVYKNMAFGLKMRNVPDGVIDERVRASAAILGIEELLHRKPKQLSGGQRQRVAVGRAIVREPEVFLLDEPLSNIDAKLRVQMRSELIKLHNRLEATMMYVTHDQVEAMSMGDRIVVMKDGLIQQVGAPMEVYDKPANLFVASFIGSLAMNFVEGVIEKRKSEPVLVLGSFSLRVPKALRKLVSSRIGEPVTVGIRPEHIYVSKDASPGTARSEPLASRVEINEPMGSHEVVELSSEKFGFVAQLPAHSGVRAGDQVKAYFDEDRIHLFDSVTGLRFG